MEHLSAEERACLAYLEETIEALEVQEDSGLSNDEPESLSQAAAGGWLLRSSVRFQVFQTNSCGVLDNVRDEDQEGTPERHREDDASTPTLSPDVSDGNTSPKPEPEAGPSAAREVGPSPRRPNVLYLAKDENGGLQIVSTGGTRAQNPEMDLSLIPPPSDFMDEPGPPGQTAEPPPPAGISKNKLVDLGLLRQRASVRESQGSDKELPERSSCSAGTGLLLDPSAEATEPKSPPVVAPKPKKLPANIVLKSHKAAPAAESVAGHPAPAGGERPVMDPQKVRMEALRKLGLLRRDEVDAGPAPSPRHSPQSRGSWAAPPSPVGPASQTPPATPSQTRCPSHAALPSPGPVSPPVLPKPHAVRGLHIIPAPAAFRDPDGADDNVPPVQDAFGHPPPVDKCAIPSSPGPSGPGPGLGEECGAPSPLGHASSREADPRRPPVGHQHSGGAQKSPRSQGISVMICPRSENEDERRGALKRLGLVRD